MTTTISEISIEVTITCEKCGKDLDQEAVVIVDHYGQSEIKIEPCPDCMAEAYNDGMEDS